MTYSCRFQQKGAEISGFCQIIFSAQKDTENRTYFRRFDNKRTERKVYISMKACEGYKVIEKVDSQYLKKI